MTRLFAFLLLAAVLAAACPSAGADNFTPVCTIPTVELFNAGGLTITAGGTVLISERFISIPVTVVNETEKTLSINLSNDQGLNGHYADSAASYGSTLKPGSTNQANINLYRSVLEAVGVTSLEQIASLEANVYNFDTVLGILTLSAPLLGLPLREADPVPNADELEPRVLAEADGLVLRLAGLSPDGKGLELCLENRREVKACAHLEAIVVNGWQLPFGWGINAESGSNNWLLAHFGEAIPGYAGLASISFDADLLVRDDETSKETGSEYYMSVINDPVRVSLEPAHPAEVPEPEGWSLLAEHNGLRVFYRGSVSANRIHAVIPLLFVNANEFEASASVRDNPYEEDSSGTITVNGQAFATNDFLPGCGRILPGAKLTADLFVRHDVMFQAGIEKEGIRTVDFNITLILRPDAYTTDSVTLPAHIELP